MLTDLVSLYRPLFHPAVDGDPVDVEEIGHLGRGKKHLCHETPLDSGLVRNTIATYKSCATSALVLSTGDGKTLDRERRNEDRRSRFEEGQDGTGNRIVKTGAVVAGCRGE
jgi:hypothetical protein